MDTSSTEKLNVLISDRAERRSEIVGLARAIQRCAFAFVAASIAVLGLYFGDNGLIGDHLPRVQNGIFICCSQLLVFVVLVALGAFCLIAINGAYVSVIERKINDICGETVSFWDSEFVPGHIFHWTGLYLWIVCVIAVFVLSVYCYLIYLCFDSLSSPVWGIIFTGETVIMLGLLVRLPFDKNKAQRIAEDTMRTSSQSRGTN